MLKFWMQPNSFFLTSSPLGSYHHKAEKHFDVFYFSCKPIFIAIWGVEGEGTLLLLIIKKEQIVVNFKILLIFLIWLFHKYLLQLHNVYVQESHLGKNSTFFSIPGHEIR